MKTKNIYIAELGYSTQISYKGDLRDYYGLGILKRTHYVPIKYLLVKASQNIDGKLIAKDLNTNRKYLCELPLSEGQLFVSPKKLIPFELIYPNSSNNLQKKKILKMGNDAIKEIIKLEKEKKK